MKAFSFPVKVTKLITPRKLCALLQCHVSAVTLGTASEGDLVLGY